MSESTLPADVMAWISEHLRRYQETNGADGHLWDASAVGGPKYVPTLLLTTSGRRTGQPIVMPLIYGVANGAFVVVASKGGAPQHPGWYLNLVAHPTVEVQVGGEKFRATARTATGAERATLWKQMAVIYPPYDEYQSRTDREIPVVVLDRV